MTQALRELLVAGLDDEDVEAFLPLVGNFATSSPSGPPPYAPERLYRSVVYGSPAPPASVSALALPQQRLEVPLRAGDAIVRVALGEPGLGHIAVLADGQLFTREELTTRGVTPEAEIPGQYAIVVEAGATPHRADEGFARLVTDMQGTVPAGQVVIRVRPSPFHPSGGEEGDAAEQEQAAPRGHGIRVVDDKDEPVSDGEYAFHQGGVVERGKLDADGTAGWGKIDPGRPFVFEVRDRVCVIRAGAFLDPDDPQIEYGGTSFDWTLVRDDKTPDTTFWPYYRREMDDIAEAGMASLGRGRVDRFLQHEHVTRRPIRVARPFLARLGDVRIRAVPAQVRVGPFVRYADHQRAVIWLECVTPTMVRVRYRKAGEAAEAARYTSTVRVGGRYFAAVEIDGLTAETFYEYTAELAPLPATGAIPVAQDDFKDVFPALTARVLRSLKAQMAVAALEDGKEWLTFRTLRPRYDRELRFATGSCRWYPGDKKDGKDWGPDMLHGLGEWLRATPKAQWPSFLFFGGDQIYSDEVGDDHGEAVIRARFAARLPGPGDQATPARDKLVDGAWAGRFAHRYKAYRDPDPKFVERVRNAIAQLEDIHRRYPDITGIYREYPDRDPRKQLRERYETLKGRRQLTGAKGEAADERKAREALALLPTVDALEISAAPFRVFLPHWKAGFSAAVRRNPMGYRYLSHNFLLWKLPEFEHQLPTITEGPGPVVARTPDARGHPPAADGVHAADFAEYAYFHERAWTSSRSVRVLLAQVPTFLMFDDHEMTDDWNIGVSWMRMLHSERDAYRMWPKTLTDGLVAYWMYQGWCNKAPSQWSAADPRVAALLQAQRSGTDALPQLRRHIHGAYFGTPPSKDPKASYQTGLSLEWHYQLPFDPPFLVPDCRSRKLMVPADDKLQTIDHDVPANRPVSQTIDERQLAWMRTALLDTWRGGPVAFIALSTPLLLQHKVMTIMTKPEVVARLSAGALDLASIAAGLLGSTKPAIASEALLRLFRLGSDVEHMIRDKSWRDLWGLAEAVGKARRAVKTLVLVSGDVHHNYCMTGNLPGGGRPRPELLQITCSGLQTTIREDWAKWFAEKQSDVSFDVGKYRLVPGFMSKRGTGGPELVLYQNAAALVHVTLGNEVDVRVDYLSGNDTHVYRYSSGPGYMAGSEPAFSPWQRGRRPAASREEEEETGGPGTPPPAAAEVFPDESAPWPESDEAEDTWDEAALDQEQSSLDPGQSIVVDGAALRTYADAVAWYTTRRDILLAQKRAFVADGYLVPDGLDDLVVAADARIKRLRKLAAQPISDSDVEGLLGWLDAYLKVMYASDVKMEAIAADRFRATQAAVERIKEQAARLQPQLRDVQRSAFRKGDESKLKQAADTFATALDSVLAAEEWVRTAATTLDDIRVLGTTLRTQKALHGSAQPWHELMRETTNARVAKLLSVAERLNKALAVWQLLDAGVAVLSGGKTASDRASAGIALATTAASAGGTLLGASGFFSLYNNLYLGPMVKRILGQIDELKDQISIGRNRPFIQLGRLDQVNWSIEPGGREMFDFMRGVMRARSAAEIGAMPASVGKFFSKYRAELDAGTPKRHGVDINYADFDDKRSWVFSFRDDIWGMLYGSMPVP